ncbi:MAG: aminotransferase-like domain-containing protein [Leptospirales bacterium]
MAENVGFSVRMRDLHASPIRETLSVIEKPGMISFAGGLPSSETFPTMDQIPEGWMQYGATEGERDLRICIARRLGTLGLPCSPEQVLILSGSQQGIDLVAKLFIDSGTPVAVESPTYLAALQVFRYFGARMVSIDLRQPERSILSKNRLAFAYVIPTFQNPTGHCYSSADREALAHLCDEAGVPVFEDDPYRDLVYDDCERTPVCASIKRAPWIYLGSFSKILAPGLRLGFLAASNDLMPYLIRLKQAADLHSNRLVQRFVLDQLQNPQFENRIERIAAFYRLKRDAFGESLSRHLGGQAVWKTPAGGLFFWVKLNRPIDSRTLLPLAIQRGVAFMPGEYFFPDGQEEQGLLRLNFSHASEEEADKGLRILADLIGG